MNERIARKMMTSILKVKRAGEPDSLGDVEYTEYEVPCYIQMELKIIKSYDNKEVNSNAQAYLRGADCEPLQRKDLLTLGDYETIDGVKVFVPLVADVKLLRKSSFRKPGGKPSVGVVYLP